MVINQQHWIKVGNLSTGTAVLRLEHFNTYHGLTNQDINPVNQCKGFLCICTKPTL